MRCPTLAELPPSPPGKTGWPWTVETPPLPPTRPDCSGWPRISIVTPSYNQGQFIEETIRSVLLQGYRDLEYVIIDGGSTDQSVEIIKKYEPWLTYWVSEKDRGQAHAINKGLSRVTGNLFNWVNSDDVLFQSALHSLGELHKTGCAIAGVVVNFGMGRTEVVPNERLSVSAILAGKRGLSWHQPGLWFEPSSILMSGGIDERLQYMFDWDLTIRYLEIFPKVIYTRAYLTHFRFHEHSKTASREYLFSKERHMIRARLSRSLRDGIHRSICRNAQHRINWERHLTEWRRKSDGAKFQIAMRMILLGLRNPRLRINRFWAGALRRTLFA
jgi:glycosyltransferase involved in cell wall biosynthesis